MSILAESVGDIGIVRLNDEKSLNAISVRYDRALMKYCNECGAAVARRWIDQDERERYVCLSCGAVHYENPRVIVSCIVSVGDKILMCRRAQEPGKGQWAPPAGFLECGETLQQGAARETYEETGVTIDPDRLDLSGVINIPGIDQILVTFRMDLETLPMLRPGGECLEVTFLSEHEVPERDFAWRRLLGPAPARFFNELRSRDFSINLITVGPSAGVGFSERYYKIHGRRQHYSAACGGGIVNKQFMADMFAAADTRDIPRFLRYLTDDVAFRFGNAPTLHGHTQVTEALTTLFQTVKKLRHTIVGVHNCGDVWAVETVAHYEDRYGRSFSVPACSLMVLRGDRMSDYKIFIDNSELFQPSPKAS